MHRNRRARCACFVRPLALHESIAIQAFWAEHLRVVRGRAALDRVAPAAKRGGQAIHGANNVPTSPQSKGCARLRLTHMDALVDWLGLGGSTSPIWNENQIAVTVNVQGEYQG